MNLTDKRWTCLSNTTSQLVENMKSTIILTSTWFSCMISDICNTSCVYVDTDFSHMIMSCTQPSESPLKTSITCKFSIQSKNNLNITFLFSKSIVYLRSILKFRFLKNKKTVFANCIYLSFVFRMNISEYKWINISWSLLIQTSLNFLIIIESILILIQKFSSIILEKFTVNYKLNWPK